MFEYKTALRDQLTPKRLTIAMWDFSYLLKRSPGEGYEDWDRGLDELVERGYNTVRIDTFPELILASDSGVKDFTFPSLNRPHFMWDNNVQTTVRPVEQVPQFVRKAGERGLKVVLSTWWWGGKINIKLRSPQEATDAWEATLKLIDDQGLADHILYVDIANEAHPPWEHMMPSGRDGSSGEPRRWGKTPQQRHWLGTTVDGVLESLQEQFPHHLHTMSFTGGSPDEIAGLGLQHADVLEYHIFTEDARFMTRTRFNKDLSKAIRALAPYDQGDEEAFGEACREFTRRAEIMLDKVGPMVAKWLWQKCERVMRLADEWCVPVTNTESGPQWFVTDHPALDLSWFKQWCEMIVDMSGEAGFWGTTTCNAAGPQFTELWADKKWHQRVNQKFLDS